MSNPTAIRPLGRVLLGATGEGEDWSALRDHLVGLGWQVDLFDPTPHAGPGTGLPHLRGVDMAILMATPLDRRSGATASYLAYLAGILQGALGDRRVLALVENEAGGLVTGTSVAELRYERDNIQARLPYVTSLLAELNAQSSQPFVTPWLERFGIVDGRVAPEMWLALGALAVIAAVLGVLTYQFVGGSTNELSAELADSDDLVDSVDRSLGSTTNDPSVLGPETAAGLGPPEQGSIEGLPAFCVIETANDQLLPETISCDGIGGLRVEGHRGPWHNQIYELTSDLGVVGHIVTEPSAGVEIRVPLEPVGEQLLEPLGSRFGVQRLELIFSANGQQVTLHQAGELGDNEATLTFGLDLGPSSG